MTSSHSDVPLTVWECKRLDCPAAFKRALELGYVETFAEYEQVRKRALFQAIMRQRRP